VKSIKAVAVVLALVSLFWSLFLQYLILVKIGATDLMWFLFISYIPMVLIVTILSKIIEE